MANGPQPPRPTDPSERARTVLKHRGLKNISILLAEQGSAESVVAWLRGVCLDGVDPTTREPIDYTHRIAAAKMLLERELGQPAQHLLLQAHVKAQLAVKAAEEQARNPYEALDDGDLEMLEAMGRKLGIDPTRVIDESDLQQPMLPAGEGEP
jgi:hypothetical protein